jgi:tRNA (guanine37-N1)-methyltransferase
MKLDPRRVYFSPREATERQRIAKQVKEGEVIMYMFSGIAPYAWVILKRQPRVHRIIAIDSNPWATRYACENAVLNKATNKVVIIRGDVREVCEGWFGRCDRVLMTYPLGASAFLGLAMKCAKRNGIIHYYSLGPEGDPFSKAVEEIKGVARRFEILDKRLVLPYKPRVYKVCVDFRVPRSKGL